MKKQKKYALIATLFICIVVVAVAALLVGGEKSGRQEVLPVEKQKVSQEIYRGNGYSLDDNSKNDFEENRRKNERVERKDRIEQKEEPDRAVSRAEPVADVIDEETGRGGSVSDATGGTVDDGSGVGGDDTGGSGGGGSGDAPKDGKPLLVCSLKNGATFNNLLAPFSVRAEDSAGKTIAGVNGRITVLVNGIEIRGTEKKSSSGEVLGRIYQAKLKEGKNTVEVKAEDSKGNVTKKNYNINGSTSTEIPKEQRIYVSVSIDISNLGIHGRFPVLKIQCQDGELAVGVIKKYFNKVGASPVFKGNYLAGIKKTGIASGAHLTQTQMENLMQAASFTIQIPEDGTINLENPSYLGEKQITNGSGWMWKYNGTEPGYGFGNATVSDGDRIVIWWTNYMGYDANGGWSI